MIILPCIEFLLVNQNYMTFSLIIMLLGALIYNLCRR